MLPKISIVSQIASNKSFAELNFLKQTRRRHILISPRSGPGGVQRLPFLKCYDIGTMKSVHPYSELNFPFESNIPKMANLLHPLTPIIGHVPL